jgi:hypothetical protein
MNVETKAIEKVTEKRRQTAGSERTRKEAGRTEK